MRRLLVQLSALFAVAVVAFCAGGKLIERPDWAQAIRTAAIDTRDSVVTWTEDTADTVHQTVTAWLDDKTAKEPPLRGTQEPAEEPAQQSAPAPVQVADAKPPAPRPAPARVKPSAPPEAHAAMEVKPEPALRTVRVSPPRQIPDEQQVAQAQTERFSRPSPQATEDLPPADQVARVRDRLRASLSSELFANFRLFLYVSKADRGPWAQRMYVFVKEDEALRLLHAYAVSTGREIEEPDANGHRQSTSTPAGYYQFDPKRMLRNYRSVQWNAPMPFSMFFNWIDHGSATGLAIHGVEGHELALLGTRASAGCVRLSPEAAQNLFNLIKTRYRGEVPRFSTDRRRWPTMSNRGELMRDKNGELVRENGFTVLVYIDNYGGEDVVSALY